MHALWMWFREGGWGMVALLVLSPVALAFSIAHAIAMRRWTFWVALASGLAVTAAGALGTLSAPSQVTRFSSGRSQSNHEGEDSLGGISEAMNCTWFGLMILGAVLVPIVVGEVRRHRAKKRRRLAAAA